MSTKRKSKKKREVCVFIWLTKNNLDSYTSYFYTDSLPYKLSTVSKFVSIFPVIKQNLINYNEENKSLKKYFILFNFLKNNLDDKNLCLKYDVCVNFTHIKNDNVFVICDY
jgi:hypothetical protein